MEEKRLEDMTAEEVMEMLKNVDVSEQKKSDKKSYSIFSLLLILSPLVIAIILWLALSIKAGLLFYGLFNLGMNIHICVTTMSKALIGRDFDPLSDVVWKLITLFITCLCFTLFFAI